VVVQYKVKPGLADENQRLVEKVFDELKRADPGGPPYASFRLADGVSFVHVASVEGADGANPLERIEAFGELTKDIGARCDEPPTPQDAVVVGSYRLL
jgi:hypothetical protein